MIEPFSRQIRLEDSRVNIGMRSARVRAEGVHIGQSRALLRGPSLQQTDLRAERPTERRRQRWLSSGRE